MDITDDNAFEVLQEVLAGRRRIRLDGGSSKVLMVLLDGNTDTKITSACVQVWFGPHRPRPMEYYRKLVPAAVYELLRQGNVSSVSSGMLIHLPPGDVAKVRRFIPWSYEAKLIWLLPGRDEVLIRVRKGDPSLETASAEPCPAGSSKAPPPLPPWKPAEKKWQTFDPPLTCQRCGASSETYRDCSTYLVCEACGCSFDMPTNQDQQSG